MEFLYTLHSHNRWLILFAAVLALVQLCIVWIRGVKFGKVARILTGLFTGLLDLQMLLGLILLFWLGSLTGFPSYRIEHGITMILAVAVVHFSARWKQSPGPIRARNTALAIIISLALIAIGISRLPQGWQPTRQLVVPGSPS